jgi:hypothetical protein
LDESITVNPHRLGFIPKKIWPDTAVRFGDLVTDFFQRKNNGQCRFYHKLYNALRITFVDPDRYLVMGVEWVSQTIFKVDKRIFAQLLGIKAVDGSLFHQQGNFPSHGFLEVDWRQAQESVDPECLAGVDFDDVRLLMHQAGVFVRDATDTDIANCKWVRVRERV